MNRNQRINLGPGFSRRQLLKYSGLGAAAVAGGSLLSACGGGDGGSGGGNGGGGPQGSGGQLIHGGTGGGAKDTLDPHQPVTAVDIARVSNLYEPLLFWNNNYELEPALAESVEPSADAITWTITMRQGVTFHNGQPVTADDAWKSIQRVADPDAPLSAGGQLSQIIDFSSTKVVDEKTLQLVLKTPYAILDSLLAEYTLGIIPGGEFDPTNPIGTGAFKYESFQAGTTSTFGKYADYWGDAAFVDSLVIQDFSDDNAKVNALQAGQVQTIDNLPYNLIETIEGTGGVLKAEGGQWVPFTMRVDQAPFDDVRVRQAMRLIVDRQAMIDQTLSGYGQLGNDMYAPLDPAYASDLPQREQDIDQAKSLLQQAGVDGLQVELFTGDDIGSVAVPAANLFAEQAKAAGVDVKVTKKNPFYDDDYLSYTFAQDFWNTRNYIPQAVVGTYPPDLGGTYNETHWDNADHRGLVDAASKELDEAKRTDLLQQAQEIEYDEGGYIIWGFRQQVDGFGQNVQGLEPSKYLPLGNYKFNKVSVAYMTQEATLPDPLVEVAPPKGRSGGAAWGLWLARRLGLAVLTLWLVSVVVFLATAALGDPVRAILGRDYDSNVARREQLEAQLGVGDSIVSRYFDWLGGLLRGDFGTSLANQLPVGTQISSTVTNTLVLVLLSALVMIPLAFGIAMVSAHYRRKRPDTVIQTILLALAGVPEFVTGILLVAVFSTSVFNVLPAVTLVAPGASPWDEPKGMVLPVATLVLAVTPYVSRIVRATLLEVLDSDYVELARLKGIPEPVVMRKHALLNAIVPGIQVIALQLAWLAGGVVLVETLFSYPGVGKQLVDAVRNHDVPVVQALSMIIAGVYIVVNLVADLLSILLTPRARTAISSMSAATTPGTAPAGAGATGPAPESIFRKALRQKRFSFGFFLTLAIVVFAVVAPFLSPFGEKETAGPPYSPDGIFGTDYLGQDVLSRLMHGGQSILVISVLATLLGMVVGVLVGVIAAYAGGWWDEVIMRLNDVVLAFPQILLALVVLTALQDPGAWVIVVLIGISHAPRVARVSRGVALGIVSRDFVVAAEALGERRSRVIVAEVLPNMTGPLLAEAGLRLTYSIGVVASLGFLGFAADPGAANWGQMIFENRLGLQTQPWAVVAPVLVIGIFTVATNLMADGLAQASQKGD